MPPMSIQAPTPKILLIDDQTLAAEMVQGLLHDQDDIELVHVADAHDVLNAARRLEPSIILVDLMMPEVDGFGVIRRLRDYEPTLHTPIILLSAEDTPELKVRGFQEGANDYLVKWPAKLELVARIRYHSSAYLALKQRDLAFQSLQQSQQNLLFKTQQLADSQAALLQAKKMEAVGKLTGGVAHDFNNVLQIIGSNLQLMKLENVGNEKVQKRIASAAEGVKRGALLASQLLAFGRRQPLQPGAVDVGALMHGVHELLRRSLGEAVEVETRVDANVWHALVDANQLENVILNLAINARDAIGCEGKIVIEATNVILDTANVHKIRELADGEYVSIAVSDNGPGMSPEVRERAFEPFFTTKPRGEGSGLGLSTAYGFAKQSGGHIEIDSELGHGTVITLYLPRAAREQFIPQTHKENEADQLGGSETILVVEDEPAVRATTVEMLSQLGYRTVEAPHAQAALDLLQGGLKVDLIFTDVVMPGPLRSAELAGLVKELLPDVEILFASGFVDGGITEKGNLNPGITLLRKPYTWDELARKIRSMLTQKQVNLSGLELVGNCLR
jgi:signal transduction histidine kinase